MYSMHIHFVLLETPQVTQKSVEGHRMITTDVHATSLSRFMLCTNCRTLFKVVSAAIFVGESDRCSFWWELYESEQSKTVTMLGVGIVKTSLVSGSYDSGGGASDTNILKTSKSTLHSVRTSQRTPRACIMYLQYMWLAVCCGTVNNWKTSGKICSFRCYKWRCV